MQDISADAASEAVPALLFSVYRERAVRDAVVSRAVNVNDIAGLIRYPVPDEFTRDVSYIRVCNE